MLKGHMRTEAWMAGHCEASVLKVVKIVTERLWTLANIKTSPPSAMLEEQENQTLYSALPVLDTLPCT